MSASQAIHHHPSDELLLAYAAGTADEAISLIVATHMHFCVLCRMRGKTMDAVGGTLLEELAPTPLDDGALNATLAKLDDIVPYERPRRAASRDGTPAVLRPYIGGDLRDVRWRNMGPRLSYVELMRRGPVTVRLLRGVPHADSGIHTHQGPELTLVLKGGYTDVTGNYGPGDFQIADDGLIHNPVADPGEPCINLAVTTGSIRFQKLLQKIAGPLFGF
jgi:putative transcriptional regulator